MNSVNLTKKFLLVGMGVFPTNMTTILILRESPHISGEQRQIGHRLSAVWPRSVFISSILILKLFLHEMAHFPCKRFSISFHREDGIQVWC